MNSIKFCKVVENKILQHIFANFLLVLTVKEFLKSDNICQSYEQM